MQKQLSHCFISGLLAGVLFIAMVVYSITIFKPRKAFDEILSFAPPAAMPWNCIGGCGAGGSGGAGGGGAKWVGQGVTGGLLDVQVLYTASIGQNFKNSSVATRLSMKPAYTRTIGLSVPVVSKIGTLQPSSADQEKTGNITGGLGDISLDYSSTLGAEGQFSLSLALALPTGQYDIKRGKDNEKKYLPTSLQKGSGLYSTTFGFSYTKDVEDGILLFDASYSYPFAVCFSGKNPFINDNKDQYNQLNDPSVWKQLTSEQKKRFEYYFKPYGENDLGGYTPPSLSFTGYYGYKGVSGFMHSWGLTFSAPLGVAWIPDFNCKSYNPKPDPDHQAWSASFNYGLEFSKPKYPIFVGVTLPIHDQSSISSTSSPAPQNDYDIKPMAHWDGPDWKDFLQQWTVAIGVKSTMF